MNRSFAVIIETFAAALVLAARHKLARQERVGKRTIRALR